jgi:hypothetical protein
VANGWRAIEPKAFAARARPPANPFPPLLAHGKFYTCHEAWLPLDHIVPAGADVSRDQKCSDISFVLILRDARRGILVDRRRNGSTPPTNALERALELLVQSLRLLAFALPLWAVEHRDRWVSRNISCERTTSRLLHICSPSTGLPCPCLCAEPGRWLA